MIEALSYEYDVLTDVSWPRLLIVAVSLAAAYRIEGRAWLRMVTTAFLFSQVAETSTIFVHALQVGSWEASLSLIVWWAIFGVVPYVTIRPELRRMIIAAPGYVSSLLPRLVAWIQGRRSRPTGGALKNREALKLLRAEGWRPGWTQTTVTDASGITHTVWVPPQRLPLGMRMHGWLAFAPTVALAGFVVWLLYVTPPWAKPIVSAGVGVGVLGHLGLLPNPLRLLGL